MNVYCVFLLFATAAVCSQTSDSSAACLDGENGFVKDPAERCESCSCENASTDHGCQSEFCPCLKMLCSRLSESKDLIRKLQTKSTSGPDEKTKKFRHEDHYSTDKRGRNDLVDVEDINPNSIIQMDKRHKRDTEQEREQTYPILERFFGMNQMIRLLSIDYSIPAPQSDSDLAGMLVVFTYFAIVVIGITICIIVYRKYGHSTSSGDLESDRQQATTVTKSLLDENPPSYEECVV